jgi:ketosteroid isomerase-like protein
MAFLFLAGCSATSVDKGQTAVNETDIAADIINMERAALDRWAKGDPSGFLEISAPDIVYFDPTLEHRLEGIDDLRRLYEPIRGKIHMRQYVMLDPKVQVCGNAAVMTYNFIISGQEKNNRWNCTEVYRRRAGKWRIIQTHWSLTQPFK